MDKYDEFHFIANNYVIDRKLYKYFSDIEKAINCINKKQIHLDDPELFNDPFDDAVFNEGIGMDGRDEYCVNGLLKPGKISCFSEVNDSILMWSYYANKHEGICLEYDLCKLDKDCLLDHEIIKNISKVHYSQIRPKGDYFDLNKSNFIFTKAYVWSHEHEWRIVCETDEEFLPFDCLTGVILGNKFPVYSLECEKLIDAVNKSGAKVQRCNLSIDKYELEIVDFDTDKIDFNIER